jgi:hypothetical protein
MGFLELFCGVYCIVGIILVIRGLSKYKILD